MRQIILFSLTASLNPTLVALTTLMLLLPRPTRLMLGYLCGALLTSVSLGLAIVFSLSDAGATKTAQHTLSPAVDLVLGVLALAAAFALATGRHESVAERRRRRKAAKAEKGPSRWQRELSKGSPRMAFVIGALLTLPGASYLAGLRAIHEQGSSTAATVGMVLAFNVVMLWLLEVPLVSFVIAPAWTPTAIERSKRWVSRHTLTIAIRGLAIIGALLIIKGAVGLI